MKSKTKSVIVRELLEQGKSTEEIVREVGCPKQLVYVVRSGMKRTAKKKSGTKRKKGGKKQKGSELLPPLTIGNHTFSLERVANEDLVAEVLIMMLKDSISAQSRLVACTEQIIKCLR